MWSAGSTRGKRRACPSREIRASPAPSLELFLLLRRGRHQADLLRHKERRTAARGPGTRKAILEEKSARGHRRACQQATETAGQVFIFRGRSGPDGQRIGQAGLAIRAELPRYQRE